MPKIIHPDPFKCKNSSCFWNWKWNNTLNFKNAKMIISGSREIKFNPPTPADMSSPGVVNSSSLQPLNFVVNYCSVSWTTRVPFAFDGTHSPKANSILQRQIPFPNGEIPLPNGRFHSSAVGPAPSTWRQKINENFEIVIRQNLLRIPGKSRAMCVSYLKPDSPPGLASGGVL